MQTPMRDQPEPAQPEIEVVADSPVRPEAPVRNEDSLFLYCPYDRKITRHGRRLNDRSIVCTECGNSVEVTANRREFTPIARPSADTDSPTRAERAILTEPLHRDARPAWPLFGALGIVAVVGVITGFSLLGGQSWVQNTVADFGTAPGRASTEVAGVSTPVHLFVANTGGSGVYLREEPEGEARVRAWPDGTVLKIVGADQSVNGATWRHVEDPAGNRGWVPALYTSS